MCCLLGGQSVCQLSLCFDVRKCQNDNVDTLSENYEKLIRFMSIPNRGIIIELPTWWSAVCQLPLCFDARKCQNDNVDTLSENYE